jgi:hypothetical protein
MVEYQVLIGSDPNRLTDRLNAHAALGFRLVGPVMPNAGTEELIASMVRVIEDPPPKASSR